MPGAREGTVDARVVVGVDGTRASVLALRYAAAEAARLGVGVDVLHVVPDHAVVTTLVDAGRHARAVVLGSDRRPVAMRLLTGNVSTGVAARCSSPLVSVPETWGPEHETGVVLAAVKHHKDSESLLAEAFELTRERGARLVVVHVVECPHRPGEVVWDREPFRERQERAFHDLEALVGSWQEEFPDVDVEVRILQGQVAHSLVRATEHADEVVILRRTHGVPSATHLGSTGRMVLLHSHCPVRVVTADPCSRGSGHSLETPGSSRRTRVPV